jgi:hypothetical protein
MQSDGTTEIVHYQCYVIKVEMQHQGFKSLCVIFCGTFKMLRFVGQSKAQMIGCNASVLPGELLNELAV